MRRFLCDFSLIMALIGSTVSRAQEIGSTFIKVCAPCHGKDGKAGTPIARKLGVKDLTRSNISDVEIVRQIRDGKKGPQGKALMPSFKDTLSPAEITNLVKFVRKLRN